MAKPEHLAKLKDGVAARNQWRAENPDARVDLADENLSGFDLSESDFKRVDRHGSDSRGRMSLARR